MTTIALIFFISDLLFPVWWIALMIVLMRKGLNAWKAWGIASSFCLSQAYLVAKFIGYSLGLYFLVIIYLSPYLIYDWITKTGPVYRDKVDFWFWVLPPFILIIIPMMILYFVSKKKSRRLKRPTLPGCPIC
jgi:hypothetical protein